MMQEKVFLGQDKRIDESGWCSHKNNKQKHVLHDFIIFWIQNCFQNDFLLLFIEIKADIFQPQIQRKDL